MGGGEGDFAGGVMFVLGLTAKSGWIFGFGVPLRGYEEFAITPDGFNPSAGGNNAPPDAFGKTYAAFTLEVGAPPLPRRRLRGCPLVPVGPDRYRFGLWLRPGGSQGEPRSRVEAAFQTWQFLLTSD
jgi:hypothetical protein